METVPAGRIVVLGTPAEEGHTGKEYMIRGGALDGVDCAMMVHGFGYDIASHVWLGRRSATITFEGVPAHASSSPFMGRNALDAATLAYQGLGLLRQQMPPGDRLYAIIEDGGDSPNVIPRHASLNLYVRSGEVETLLDLSRRVEWDLNPMSLPVRNNEAPSHNGGRARRPCAAVSLCLPASFRRPSLRPRTLATSRTLCPVSTPLSRSLPTMSRCIPKPSANGLSATMHVQLLPMPPWGSPRPPSKFSPTPSFSMPPVPSSPPPVAPGRWSNCWAGSIRFSFCIYCAGCCYAAPAFFVFSR